MAKAQKKTVRVRSSLTTKKRARMLGLSAEMLRVALDIQSALGVNARDAKDIFQLATKLNKNSSRESDEVLAISHGMTKVLAKWHKSPEYAASDGSPKILPIFGKGISFETLAKRYVPQMDILAAVEFLISHSDVRRQSGDRLALLGSPALIIDKASDVALALIIQRVRRLSRSVVVNSGLPPKDKATGRYERQVTGMMTKKQFEEFSKSIRGQLQDVVDHVDGRLEEERPNEGELHECGLSVFLWADF